MVLRTCTFHWFWHCSPRDFHVWLVDKVDVSYLFKQFSFETSLIFSLPSSECTVQNSERTLSVFNQPVFENASHCWISLSRCQCTCYWRTSRRILLSLLPLLLCHYKRSVSLITVTSLQMTPPLCTLLALFVFCSSMKKLHAVHTGYRWIPASFY